MESKPFPIQQLPGELLRLIFDFCDEQSASAWARTSASWYRTVGHMLYEAQVARNNWKVLFWAAYHGSIGTLKQWTSIRNEDGGIRGSLSAYVRWTFDDKSTYTADPFSTGNLQSCQMIASPIHMAAMGGQLEAVQFLLDNGANIDACSLKTTPHGLTVFNDARDLHSHTYERCALPAALHTSIICGHAPVAELLVARGADIRLRPLRQDYEIGVTALHLAAAYGMETVIRLICHRSDVDVDAADCNGQSPLVYAAESAKGHISLRVLKELGANVNIHVSIQGGPGTPLLVALIQRIRWRAALKLMDCGATVHKNGGREYLLEVCNQAKDSAIHPDVPDPAAWDELVSRISGDDDTDSRTGAAMSRIVGSPWGKLSRLVRRADR
ncbi:hypothetical protein JX266_005689 [Neoarthrinium moseri]|nr:hypothetical protein JX266_005689 [Neoarthrinium moseri]